MRRTCAARCALRQAPSRPFRDSAVQPRHIALAFVLAFFWGLNFVVITVALVGVPPLLLAAVRFALAAIPVVFLPRPSVPWPLLVAIAATHSLASSDFCSRRWRSACRPGSRRSPCRSRRSSRSPSPPRSLRRMTDATGRSQAALLAFLGLLLVATTVGARGVTLAGFLLLLALPDPGRRERAYP